MKPLRFALVTLFVVISFELMHGQVFTPSSPFLMSVDYARFKNNDSTGYVEFYFLFYPGLVSTERNVDGVDRGSILLRVEASEKTTGALYINELRILPVSISDSTQRLSSNTLVSQANYVLRHGTYTFTVSARDSIMPHRSDSLRLDVAVVPVPVQSTMSDIELCSKIAEGTSSSPFMKNTLEVVPNATLMFGVTSHPVAFHYTELYNIVPGKPYLIATSVLDAQGTALRIARKNRTFSGIDGIEVGTTNVTSLPSGKYIMQVSVMEDTMTTLASTRKVFFVHNPHIKLPTPSAVSLKASELAGLEFDELGKEFAQAAYLANTGDKDQWSKLTTAEARREYLAEFWTRVERQNTMNIEITRSEYLRRVKVAMERYRVHGREGWQTDRGRVYCLWAEPDDIERVPSDENAKPHEVWNYYQVENGVEFVFIDRSGFGDYILVHSTKRGELQDETWQRLLR